MLKEDFGPNVNILFSMWGVCGPHLSQDLHTGGQVLACRGMAQRVLTHEGDHLVKCRHTNLLQRQRLLCFVCVD